jgi:hypothetical protein
VSNPEATSYLSRYLANATVFLLDYLTAPCLDIQPLQLQLKNAKLVMITEVPKREQGGLAYSNTVNSFGFESGLNFYRL